MTVFGVCLTFKEVEDWVVDNLSDNADNAFDEFEALMESYSFDVIRAKKKMYIGRIVEEVEEEDDKIIIESDQDIDIDEEYLDRLFPTQIIRTYSDIDEW